MLRQYLAVSGLDVSGIAVLKKACKRGCLISLESKFIDFKDAQAVAAHECKTTAALTG